MIIPCPDSRKARSSRSFALVITLVMVALVAIVAVGLMTSTSLERATAKSYDNRYQAELAVQSGLEAAKKTFIASPSITNSVTGTDTFLVLRADNGSATYYYLAQPTDISQQSTASVGSSSITYYPLFSTTQPSPAPQTIDLTAAPLPKFPPLPTPTPGGASEAVQKASNGTIVKRFPTLYSWQQPTSTAGPSVDWVEMRDPEDTATAPAHNLPYTRYAYWAEDLDGYLDASQVNDPNGLNARINGQSTWTDGTGTQHSIGTSPGEIAMFTIFAPAQQTISAASPTPIPVTNLVGSTETGAQNKRSLLFTVPTVQQIAATTPDVAGPNLAVRLGMDSNPGEQNLIPLGYGYTGEGQPKTNLNASISQLISANGNAASQFPLGTALPAFGNRSSGNGAFNYLSNLAANIADYASPQAAPTDFNPPGQISTSGHSSSNSYRGIGAYPFVASVYDLNNWVLTYLSSGQRNNTYHVVIEVRTYVQLWNPHNVPVGPGVLEVEYENSDQASLNGHLFTLQSPPDATITFANGAPSDPNQPFITSTLNATGKVGKSFNYQITASVGSCAPMQPNSYLVIVLPQPTVSGYGATGLPPGLTVSSGGAISGTPTSAGPFNVTINSTSSSGTTGSATLAITINP